MRYLNVAEGNALCMHAPAYESSCVLITKELLSEY